MDKKYLIYLLFVFLISLSVFAQSPEQYDSAAGILEPDTVASFLLESGLVEFIMNNFMFVMIVLSAIILLLHVYLALVLMTVAKKTGTPHTWMAWIPGANVFLMAMVADVPWWSVLILLVAYLIPFLNILAAIVSGFFGIFLWWRISEKRGFPAWLSFLLLVPILNLVIIGYIAWGRGKEKSVQKSFEDPRIIELRVYVKEAYDRGMTSDQIRAELEKSGWSKNYIRKVI